MGMTTESGLLGADVSGNFVKYEKMAEDSGTVGASAVGCSNAYIVTEKVHGANFCIIASFAPAGSDSVVIRFAKRTAVLGGVEDAEDFYSCRSAGLLRDSAPCGEAVLRRLAAGATSETVQAVHIYGELFGGSYPHPDVAASPGMEPVQCGIWYAPDLHFMAFDVAVETSQRRAYLSFDVARNACMQSGLRFAAPLLRGTLADCLGFEIEFASTVPGQLGLPLLSSVDGSARNLAEGVVVRPEIEPLGSHTEVRGRKESMRGMFKRKIAEFNEKRYQNNDWKKGKAGRGGRANSTVDDEKLAAIEIAALVTQQRLANVLSKIGRVNPKDREACRALLQDLKEDVAEALDSHDLEILQRSTRLKANLDEWCRALITQELLGAKPK
jgi:Rnl2 family RNA ligase